MEYIMKKGEILSLTAAARPVLKVKDGAVWLTSDGNCRDYLLQRGDSFAMESCRLVVIEALEDCSVEMFCPDQALRRVMFQLPLTN